MGASKPVRLAPRVPTPVTITLILGWLALAAWAAAVMLMTAGLSVAVFFGESPTAEEWREGIGFSVGGVAASAAGPLGIWLFHRRRAWLIAAAAIVAISALSALYILLTFSAG